MSDSTVEALAELSSLSLTTSWFYVEDRSEVDVNNQAKEIPWGTIEAAIDTIITANNSGYLVAANDLSDVASASTARTNLGLAIGTDVQAYDAGLADIAGLAVTDGNIIVGDGANWVAESGATARTSLGLAIGTDVQAWNDDLDDIAALTPTKGNLLVGNGTDWVAVGVGTNTQVLTANSAEASGIEWAASAGGGLSDVVDDTTPQLGGNLDVNGNSIVSVSAGDINITPDTTGSIILDGLSWPQSDGTANYVLETDGAGQLGWVAQSGGGGSDTLADIATNSTTTAHQTFALDAATSLIIEDSGGADILTVDEATGATEIIYEDSGTNNTVNALSLKRNSTGTPSFNFGPAFAVFGESNTTVDRQMGRFSWTWGDMTDATRRSKLKQSVYYTTTEQVFLTVDGAAAGTPTAAFAANMTNSGTFKISGADDAIKLEVKNNAGTQIFGVNTVTPSLAFGASINHSKNFSISGANDISKFVVSADNAFQVIRAVTSDYASTLGIGGATQITTYNTQTFSAQNAITIRTTMDGGTPTTNFGSAIRVQLRSSTTDHQDAVRLIGKWTTATHATRAAEGALTAHYTSTERTPIRWGASSTASTLGFHNTTPIVQHSSTGQTAGFTAGSGTAVNDDSTFTGGTGTKAYTIGDIIKFLKERGDIASS